MEEERLCGAPSSDLPIDEEAKQIFARVAEKFISGVGLTSASDVTLVSYRQQVVAGMNYFIVVKCANDKNYELRIYNCHDGSISLSSYRELA